jgi:hypothetical protein
MTTPATPTTPTDRPPGSRSVLLLLTVPASMVNDDQATIRRKMAHPQNVEALLDLVAAEAYRCLRDPDTNNPELLLARVSAEMRKAERAEHDARQARLLGIRQTPTEP